MIHKIYGEEESEKVLKWRLDLSVESLVLDVNYTISSDTTKWARVLEITKGGTLIKYSLSEDCPLKLNIDNLIFEGSCDE